MFDYVFIDFDKTLFDCFQFEQDMWRVVEMRGVLLDDYKTTYLQALHGFTEGEFDYTFEEHLQLLEEKGYSNLNGVLALWNNLLENDYLFDGAYDILEFLKKNSAHVVLLTAGDKQFQMKKINSTQIKKYLSDIVVLNGHKETYLSHIDMDEAQSLFINDSMRENNMMREMFKELHIIVRFDTHKYGEEEIRVFGAPYFVSLKDMLEYLKNK